MPKKVSASRNSNISFEKEFYSDLSMENMQFAVIVRCPANEGIVKSIMHPNLPEGYTLVTARDVPGSNLVDIPNGKTPLFCEGNISYEGEPLGILTGPDENMLNQILDELEITIDTNTIEDYLPDEDILKNNIEFADNTISKRFINKQKKEINELIEIKEEFFSDRLTERTLKFGPCFEADQDGNIPGIDSVFAGCAHTVERDWSYSLCTPNYSEPNGAMCFWKNDSLTIFTPTQWLKELRKIASQSLAIDSDKIILKKTVSTNRGSNSIWYNSIIACQVAVASLKSGKPVKLVYSRDEQNKFLNTMQPVNIKHKTGIDENGNILAMQVDIHVDAGFANPFAKETIDRLIISACGCYSPINILVTARADRSLAPASNVDMQLVDSAAFFAIENQMNEAAAVCGLTPIELRLKNYREYETKKNKTPCSPFNFNLESIPELINVVATQSDFNRRYASYHLDSKDWKKENNPKEYVSLFSSPMRGIGFSCAFEGSGYYGSELNESTQTIDITLEEDRSLTIHCPPVSESIQDIWIKTASAITEIPQSQIKFNSVFNSDEEPPIPESIYSGISIMTALLSKCCQTIRKKKDTEKLPFTVKKRMTSTLKNEWNAAKFCGKPFHSTSSIAVVLELEINPCSYREKIRKITMVVNGGKILNVQSATASIRLCIQKVLSSLLKDDKIEIPELKISFKQSEREPSQIGELVYQAIPAAFTQALTQALNCTINLIPFRTDFLYKKLKEQQAFLRNQRKLEEEQQNSREAKENTTEISEDENSTDTE